VPVMREYAGCKCVGLACMQDWAGRTAQLPGHGLPAGDASVAPDLGRGPSSSSSAPSSAVARQRSAAADMSEQSGARSSVAKPSLLLNDRAVVEQAQVDQTADDDLPVSEPAQGQDLEGEGLSQVCVFCRASALAKAAATSVMAAERATSIGLLPWRACACWPNSHACVTPKTWLVSTYKFACRWCGYKKFAAAKAQRFSRSGKWHFSMARRSLDS
jgi:hypothetical protein